MTATEAAVDDSIAFGRYLRGVEDASPRTADSYRSYARTFTVWLTTTHPGVGFDQITPLHVRGWLESQEQRGVSGTARRVSLYGLRAFYRWRNLDTPNAPNPAQAVHPPRQPLLVTHTYTANQAARILTAAAAGATVDGRFDYAVLATLRYAGLRNDELVNLRTANVDLEGATIHVLGKGRKARTIPIPARLVAILDEYLTEVRPELDASAFLFASPRSMAGGSHVGRVSNRSVHAAVHRLGVAAGVPGRHHPHRWRHAYATGQSPRGHQPRAHQASARARLDHHHQPLPPPRPGRPERCGQPHLRRMSPDTPEAPALSEERTGAPAQTLSATGSVMSCHRTSLESRPGDYYEAIVIVTATSTVTRFPFASSRSSMSVTVSPPERSRLNVPGPTV